MIDPVVNFQVDTVELSGDLTNVIFSFVKPSGAIGGYYLYASSTGSTYSKIQARIDSVHNREESLSTYDSGGTTYFEYTFPDDSTDGKLLYFKIQAVSTTRELSVFSSVVTTYTFPSKPTDLFIKYDGYEVELEWTGIDTSAGKNASFIDYAIYQNEFQELSGSKLVDTSTDTDDTATTTSTGVLLNSSFVVGKYVLVVDIFKRTRWFGIVSTAGQFPLDTTTKTIGHSDTSLKFTVVKDNLRVFIEGVSNTLIGTTTSTNYTSSSFTLNDYYLYSVVSEGSPSLVSNATTYPVYTVDIEEIYPYLRSVDNSSTGLLNNPYWKSLKNVLIDGNYYDKNSWSIPYAKDTDFNIVGYLGLCRCNLDVFINEIYGFTTSTGDYGEFGFNYLFPKGETILSFQARDKFNIKFSRNSAPHKITTYNMYTNFSVLGTQYQEIYDELERRIQDVSISDCRYSTFEDVFASFVELYKQGSEDETKFRDLSAECFKAFEYAAYDKALYQMLDAFQDNVDEIDHYEVHFNNGLYQTHHTGFAYAPAQATLTGINYFYGVSARTSTGEETIINPVRVDRRWWPPIYTGYNVFRWNESAGADTYRIYRGITSTGLYLLAETPYNYFVDNGTRILDTSTGPVDMNFTDIDPPANLIVDTDTRVAAYMMRLKKPYHITIILYAVGDVTIPAYQITRIRQLLAKYVPPEIKYLLIGVNDSTIVLYPGGIVNIDISYTYARYDISTYYDPDNLDNHVFS